MPSRRIFSLFPCVFGLAGLLSACLTSGSDPATGLPAETPRAFTAEGGPSEEDPAPAAEEGRDTAEASPTWMAPTPGSVQCTSTLWVRATISLEDRSALSLEDLSLSLKVVNAKTGEEETLRHHGLTAKFLVPYLDKDLGEALAAGNLRRVEEGGAPSSVPIAVTIDSRTVRAPSNDGCKWVIEEMHAKKFLLKGVYRDGAKTYAGEKEFALAPPPDQRNVTTLGEIVLSLPAEAPEEAEEAGPFKGVELARPRKIDAPAPRKLP